MPREKVIKYLTELLSKEIKLSPDRIDVDKNFEKYGIDSIAIINLNKVLETQFGAISKTLFYEYKNISELTEYFMQNHKETLEELFHINNSFETAPIKESKESSNEIIGNKLTLTAATTKSLADTSISELQKSRIKKAQFSSDIEKAAANPKKEIPNKFIPENSEEEIAVIGVSGRYPMAKDLEELWANLCEGKDCITPIPGTRWDNRDYYSENKSELGKIYLDKGGFMEDIDKFDPLFFGISPNEAILEDPHERLFLETVWNTLEDGGYTKKTIAGKDVGVYVGVMWGQYQLLSGEVKGTLYPGITSYSSIANRVSYFLDLKGPSIAIDTMCSSSLTAIHLACESIKRGESTMAIAGGVNLTIHPNKYIQLCGQKFASMDGHCKSFGEGGDGYVPGEGVGAILLKPLSQAVEDGDYIYGVIKATAINHGGETNGYSVPSPKAQAQVISEVLHKGGISARDISFVEAHGTGTALGDPIEINGLSKAYEEYTQDKDYCSIGSIKSNIGHLEGAAGIAAVTKVLLQMKYKKLVPSLFSQVTNPNIDFKTTPFYIQQELKDWLPVDRSGRTIPRTAAVSSFGAGGSNAHALIREYISKPAEKPYRNRKERNNIFLLSAVNEVRLMEYRDKIIKDLETNHLDQKPETDFERYLYTLQKGREEMEYRLAVIAADYGELYDKLQQHRQGKSVEEVYTGNTKESKEGFHKYLKDFIDGDYLKSLMEQDNLKKLAEIWILGGTIDWNLLYEELPEKLPVPGYPFARESYWVGEMGKITGMISPVNNSLKLAPFIDENLSTFEEQCYKKELSGTEAYLAHHVIQGNKILPGSVYLELILEAVQLSFPGYEIQTIGSIQWIFPFISKKSREDIYTRLYTREEDIAFEIYSTEGERKNIHCNGLLGLSKAYDTDSKVYNVSEIIKRCEKIETDSGEEVPSAGGYHYGPYYRCIKELYAGEKEVLSYLELEPRVHDTNVYVLHPALIDGAFQSVIGFTLKGKRDHKIYLPYSAADIILYRQLKNNCYVYIKEEAGHNTERKEYRIFLLEEDGQVIAEFGEFVLKSANLALEVKKEQNYYFTKELTGSPITADSSKGDAPVLVFAKDSVAAEHLKSSFANILTVLESEKESDESRDEFRVRKGREEDFIKLVRRLKETQKELPACVLFQGNKDINAEDTEQLRKTVEEDILSVYFFTKALIAERIQSKITILFLYKAVNYPSPQYEGLAAFGTVLRKENPLIAFRTVAYDKELSAEEIHREFTADTDRTEAVYQKGKRYENQLIPLMEEEFKGKAPLLLAGKTYLITGGLGGIGYIYAKYLAKTYECRLALLGRSPLNEEMERKVAKLKEYSRGVVYIQADVTEAHALREALIKVKEELGEINGVIHCSGVLKDSFLINKTESDIKAVLAPKLYGVSLLDNLLKAEKLDFFLLCSSVAAISASVGQTDYAYANSYMDSYARFRNQLVSENKRYGKTLSVNWPLWENGGMHITEEMVRFLKDSMGLVPLSDENGIEALETLLKAEPSQIMVLEGNKEKIYESLSIPLEKKNTPAAYQAEQIQKNEISVKPLRIAEVTADKDARLHKTMLEYLIEAVAYETGMRPKDIDPEEELTRYGIESVKIMNLTAVLEEDFGELSKTLFYEYLTIKELAGYFLSNHLKEVLDIFHKKHPEISLEKEADKKLLVPKVADTQVPDIQLSDERQPKKLPSLPSLIKKGLPQTEKQKNTPDNQFAIIGLSGHYPMASDLMEFWKNLCEGLDCITRVPDGHWTSDLTGSLEEKVNTSGGFLEDIDAFDPLFFHISPKEAARMDPQERLFLQTAWEVIEDAGYTGKTLKNYKTGVFVGAMNSEYQLLGLEENLKGNDVNAGAVLASISNRVSYSLNLTGPSITLDTMCSSALSAILMAIQNIELGYCDMAIAGGVNLSLHPSKYKVLSTAHFLSSEGKCRSFGEGGDGYVPGEGVGAVLIKPLAKAIEDKDNIYGVILGSNINHGGKTNGYSVPSPTAQKEAVLHAIERAGIHPETISYLEAHGTGTALGDPIEIDGLTKAFGKYTGKKEYCAIGSVKSNIGHLESAAGMAGLTKILLQMKYQTLVPSLHAGTINKNIKMKETPFYIQDTRKGWKGIKNEKGLETLRAGLSSFGAGGTNVHMILENFENPLLREERNKEELFILSAKDSDRLKEYVQKLLHQLKTTDGIPQESTLVQEIKELVGTILSVEASKLEEKENLREYGIDRVVLEEILTQINESYNYKITDISLDNISIQALADRLSAQEAGNANAITRHQSDTLKDNTITPFHLSDIAFTFQTGREEMEERLAVIASSVAELTNRLEDYLNNRTSGNMYQGNIRNAGYHTLMDSSAGRQFTKQLLLLEEYPNIAQFWVNGISFDWEELWQDNRGRRISLPTYPFAKERYWIAKTTSAVINPDQKEEPVPMNLIKTWVTGDIPEGKKLTGKLLILYGDKQEVLAKSLFPEIHLKEKIYINLSSLTEQSTFVKDFSYKEVSNFIDISSLAEETNTNREERKSTQIIQILQNLIKERNLLGCNILQLTSGLQDFLAENLSLGGALTAGIYKMLSAEYKKINAKTVDLDDISDVRAIEHIITQEIASPLDSEVCYRLKKRYIPEFIAKRVEIPGTPEWMSKVSKEQSIVITGGTNGIGLAVAGMLLEQGYKKLALMGFHEIPEKFKWQEILEKENTNSREYKKISGLYHLEQNGAEILLYTGSLEDKLKLTEYFREVEEKLGQIAGVIHCAGLSGSGSPAFIHKTPMDFERVFSPKAAGLNTLHEIFKSKPLKFFTLFSSVSAAFIPLSAGLSDYAAGNSYMDFFAAYQRSKGYQAYQSINWTNWKLGMGEAPSQIYKGLGLLTMDAPQGIALVKAVLGDTLLVKDGVLGMFPKGYKPVLKTEEALSGITAIIKPADKGKTIVDNNRNYEVIMKELKAVFSEELDIPHERLEEEKNFAEFGVDSILMADVILNLENRFHTKLDPSIVLEYPTLKQLALYLTQAGLQDGGQDSILQMESAAASEAMQKSEESAQILSSAAVNESVQKNVLSKKKTAEGKKIAVIGMACHFPKAENKDKFWRNLLEGVDCITEVPKDRWDTSVFYSERGEAGKSISKWGGFLDNIQYFDPEYFGFPKENAESFDPLLRQMLEVSAETFQDGGYTKDMINNQNIGVFIGSRSGDYASRIKNLKGSSLLGVAQNFIATHISQTFNLHGPACVIDTACSSSLVSIHYALQSILTGDSDMAIAGGVDILLDERTYATLSASQALSPDGRCHTFDEKANGFVPGEGAGAVLLKEYEKAVADGDKIYAVIDATAVNNDGKTMGVTTPNLMAQEAVITKALEKANLTPGDISYIETHGTGTMIGDPIELKALRNVFEKATGRKNFCGVGSVKTNVGHMMSAAGIGSFIKVVLALHHRILPASINCEKVNPRFHIEDSPFYIVRETKPLLTEEKVIRAGISSFGFGGTNAHIIVSECPERTLERGNREALPVIQYTKERFWLEKKEKEETQLIKAEENTKNEIQKAVDLKTKTTPKQSMFEIEDSGMQ